MSLNIAIVTTLLATAACSGSGSSNSPSKEPELTGYWKSECYPLARTTAPANGFVVLQIKEDATISRTRFEFNNAECTGDAANAYSDDGTFTAGTVVSQNPLTQEFHSFISCTDQYSTVKIENSTLFIANGPGDGLSEDQRQTDFTNADEYTPITEADLPAVTQPVSVQPSLCLL
ncbi:hypothetical protein [Bdellovibrio bacteriovorus]|uniref:Uncharacterized protein n=1 Tax=Bdellovibrio bacteriovorus str. Tiberius TaxID=1069642 RepID=K7YZY5_BDEBC|nr:hypothetical protein [Bdellovibrio bacteriovorus]AFY02300.1 hypothetical protein Bdt_2618 [Bdellovibrio bacteriovorus str. Tiberius]